jgi:protein ImuA
MLGEQRFAIENLAEAALHEFYAVAPDDASTALALALLLAGRSRSEGAILWAMDLHRGRGARPYAPGLAALGVAPERLVLVHAPDTLALLRAAADAVACPALAAVVIACPYAAPAFDLTASRRLALAAARSRVAVLAVRGGTVVPSAAQTRWAVRRRRSRPLAAEAPGHMAFALELLRNRAGPAGLCVDLEWDSDARCFHAPRFRAPCSRAADFGRSAALAADREGCEPIYRAA